MLRAGWLGALAERMGGTSGGIYSLLFTAGARAFQVYHKLSATALLYTIKITKMAIAQIIS